LRIAGNLLIMKLNLFERIVLGIGIASVVLFLVATFGPLKTYRETFRILMLLSLGTYIVYTYLLQNKESNDRAELESQIASLEANNRALEQAHAETNTQLAAAQTELQGLRAALANAGLDAPAAGVAKAPKAAAPKKPASSKTAAAAKKPAAKSTPVAKKPAAPRTPKAE
jgi:hypothetical protein